jgi:hypothetical protein
MTARLSTEAVFGTAGCHVVAARCGNIHFVSISY